MPLNKFQTAFKDLMLQNPDALEAPPTELASLCEIGEIALPERLKVYRNNIVGSLTDVMIATFPIIDKLVGRQFLELMARSYILENPPKQGCLNLYGAGFDRFIEGFELAKSLPYLPDVARFELALNAAYYAADDEALGAEELAALAPEELSGVVLRPRASVSLVRSRYPILDIQAFCKAEQQDGQLRLDQGGVALMVYRPALDTQSLKIEDSEFMLLSLLGDKTLGGAVEAVLEKYHDFDFQGFLQKHLALETFQRISQNAAA